MNTETTKEVFQEYEMPPIYSRRLLHLASQDSNHGADGPLYQVTEYCLGDPNRRGRRYPRPNPGVRPLHTEKAAYAEHAIRYPDGFMFQKNELICETQITGSLWDTSESGREYIAQLLADDKIYEVGMVTSRGEWVDIHLSGFGVNEVFGVYSFARSRLIRKADGFNVAPLVDCPLYIATKNTYLPSCRPCEVQAGALIPSCIVKDMPGGAYLAGSVDANGFPTLTGPALDYYRALTVITADCRNRTDEHGNAARMSSEQEDYLDAKLKACAVEVAAVE